MPSATTHCAGVLSFAETHWLSSLPSKRTIASDGGSESFAPGVTTGGTGCHTSVSSGFIVDGCWAKTGAATTTAKSIAHRAFFMTRSRIAGTIRSFHLPGLEPVGQDVYARSPTGRLLHASFLL